MNASVRALVKSRHGQPALTRSSPVTGVPGHHLTRGTHQAGRATVMAAALYPVQRSRTVIPASGREPN
jgi:hypothetical protein